MPGNLTLFQTKETQFCYPVPDKMVKLDTLFQTTVHVLIHQINVRRNDYKSETACSSKHAAGLERKQQQCSFAARFWQEKSNANGLNRYQSRNRQKVYPVPDRNADL